MAFDNTLIHQKGLEVFAYFGQSGTTGEALSGTGTNWSFANTPVSTQGMRLFGVNDSGTGFVLNWELEPLSGTMVTNESFASITANYNSYPFFTSFLVDTASWNANLPVPEQRQDIDADWHATLPFLRPRELNFRVVQTAAETILNFVSIQVLNAYYFLVIDQVSKKAYEGPIISDRVLAINKGFEPFVPAKVLPQKFGKFDPDTHTIDWSQTAFN